MHIIYTVLAVVELLRQLYIYILVLEKVLQLRGDHRL
jgi:hypothetical protein